ncbi:hypothetical protein D0859_01523 [Hortaea werneckii]|uniref:Uncharacterized protein n=1 Tax=Hortaea werneckii TaxID=91943 RepID=A0A3M7J965_HORWE|nr:hypothetical protein D0859_01523 [Hortaea werneckii]
MTGTSEGQLHAFVQSIVPSTSTNHTSDMASSRALRPLSSICASCARRQQVSRRPFATSPSPRFDDIRSNESRLPRIASPSLWSSLIPRAFRRSSLEELEAQAAAQNAKPKEWNPYTIFILLAIVVGSNAINTLALRNEMLNYNRKTDAKLELLREVVQRIKDGEDVDVKKMLGTGDAQAEKEWEEVMRDLENTDALAEGQKRREAKRAAKAEERKAQEAEKLAAKERDASVTGGSTTAEATKERRPKFMM